MASHCSQNEIALASPSATCKTVGEVESWDGSGLPSLNPSYWFSAGTALDSQKAANVNNLKRMSSEGILEEPHFLFRRFSHPAFFAYELRGSSG
jgi:hypothetical protein